MADMDLDDILDGTSRPSRAPARTVRFAPKGAKIQPRPKTEPSQSIPPSASDSMNSVPVPKKEEPVNNPVMKPEYANDAIKMDVELKPEVKEDLMETEAMEAEPEPGDEVVREIDVYLNHSVDPKTLLYVLQYPLRPLWRPYELDEKCEEVRVKPASTEVEIDLAVDVCSKNYDSDADPRVQMKKQTLTPSWTPPHTSGHAVAVLTQNKLYLNPIHAVVQLRPSMRHLESGESKKKKNVVPSNIQDTVMSEEPQERRPSRAPKKLGKVPEQTTDSGEGWVPLKYHSSRSNMAAGYLQKMMAREDGGTQIYFPMSSRDYLHSLCPGTSSDSYSSNAPPIRSLLALPLKERFKTWLLKVNALHKFDALKHLAPDESIEEVLEILQEHARLVQGLWVPKTSLVCGREGIEFPARDYVLALFSKNVIIKESQIPRRPKLEKAMKEVLSTLAVWRPTFNDWKLKELPDLSFIKSYPSLVMRQKEQWECIEKKLNDTLPGGTNRPAVKSNTTNNMAVSKSSNKVAAGTPNGATSRTPMSDEVREAIKKALQKLFKSVKICSFQQISQRLRDMAVSESTRSTGFSREAVSAVNSIDAYPDELQAIISQVAVNIHGICVPKSSPDYPQYDPFRKVVIDLFIAEGPNAKIKKASITEAANMELKREISQIEYQKVLQELCTSQGSAWVLKSTG